MKSRQARNRLVFSAFQTEDLKRLLGAARSIRAFFRIQSVMTDACAAFDALEFRLAIFRDGRTVERGAMVV